MKEFVIKNKNKILIFVLLFLVVVVFLFKIFSDDNKKSKISIVTSSSKFYTVSSCISRYINYLYSEDVDNIILLLDNSYRKKNNIDASNLFDNIEKFDSFYSFQARKMYEEKINDSITKYYVYGYLLKEELDNYNYSEKKDYYIIIYLNSTKDLYSVAPYDGDIFINGGDR